jgi:hypothetical protein
MTREEGGPLVFLYVLHNRFPVFTQELDRHLWVLFVGLPRVNGHVDVEVREVGTNR